MIEPTRHLCKSYTDLTEAEIAFIEEYTPNLQALANAEQADVFIDCRTSSGKSAIVVSEAKPATVPSSYSKSLHGLIVRWEDEPAVERTFRLGVPTVGMRAVSVPEDGQVVQTVDPLFFQGKLVAVLIYEKRSTQAEERFLKLPVERGVFFRHDSRWMADRIQEAALLVDREGRICDYNAAARALYRRLGYVNDIMGMTAAHILPYLERDQDEVAELRKEVASGAYVLEYHQIPLEEEGLKYGVLIRDITDLRHREQEAMLLSVSLRELKHRMKNNLQLLSRILRDQGERAGSPEIQGALRDASVRLMSIMSTLDELVQLPGERISLRHVLEEIRSNVLNNMLTPAQGISIVVTGTALAVPAETGVSVALVVNELTQNAVRHAFPDGRPGRIELRVETGVLSARVSVRDDGVGMAEVLGEGGIGLNLVRTIVREKLGGEVSIQTGPAGTDVSFDFYML